MVEVLIRFVTSDGQERWLTARVKCLSRVIEEEGKENVIVVADPAPEGDLKNLGRDGLDHTGGTEKGV